MNRRKLIGNSLLAVGSLFGFSGFSIQDPQKTNLDDWTHLNLLNGSGGRTWADIYYVKAKRKDVLKCLIERSKQAVFEVQGEPVFILEKRTNLKSREMGSLTKTLTYDQVRDLFGIEKFRNYDDSFAFNKTKGGRPDGRVIYFLQNNRFATSINEVLA